jgi:hypothetical protein
LEDVEKDLRGMKVKRWRKKEAGRAEWAYWGSWGCQRVLQLSKEVSKTL